jgi:NodT family efflux transporter outer membrane factor (OMF) lipoprotein
MTIKYIKGAVLLGVILSAGFTSCGIVNNYKAPETDSENLFRGEGSTDTTTIANIPWREYFTDPALQALIDEGLNNNFDMRIAYTRIQQAEAGLLVAKSAYFPTLALVGQASHTQISRNMITGKENVLGYSGSTQYNLGIAVQWEADLWGKLSSKSRAQYANLISSHAYRNLIQTSLVSNIATTYYSLLALDEQLKITLETIELLKESTSTMDAMMQAGLLNRAGVKQSEALLYSTEVSVPALESQIRQLENSLSVLVGRKPGSFSRTSIQNQTIPMQLDYGIPTQMLAKRSDVLQAEMGFRYAFEMKNVAQRSLYPSLTLNSGSMVGYASNTLSQFFKPTNILANIIGGLTQPIFAGNQLRGQLKVAKAQQEEALLTFEKTVLSASEEVSNIMYTYESSLRKNENRTKQVSVLRTAVDDTKMLLSAGEANYTEVLNAEQSLLQAQLGQVNDKLEQLQATVNLYRALGGGVE